MTFPKVAPFAALLAVLAFAPVQACDYSGHSHVTAEAEKSAEPATDAVASQPQPAASAVVAETPTTPAPAQTAAVSATTQPRAN